MTCSYLHQNCKFNKSSLIKLMLADSWQSLQKNYNLNRDNHIQFKSTTQYNQTLGKEIKN